MKFVRLDNMVAARGCLNDDIPDEPDGLSPKGRSAQWYAGEGGVKESLRAQLHKVTQRLEELEKATRNDVPVASAPKTCPRCLMSIERTPRIEKHYPLTKEIDLRVFLLDFDEWCRVAGICFCNRLPCFKSCMAGRPECLTWLGKQDDEIRMRRTEDPKKAWEWLTGAFFKHYAPESSLEETILEFASLQAEGDSVDDVKSVEDKIDACLNKVPQLEKLSVRAICSLMAMTPKIMEGVVTELGKSLRDTGTPSADDLKRWAFQRARDLSARAEGRGVYFASNRARTQSSNRRAQPYDGNFQPRPCFHCESTDHLARACPVYKKFKEDLSTKAEKQGRHILIARNTAELPEDQALVKVPCEVGGTRLRAWLDTGASSSVFPARLCRPTGRRVAVEGVHAHSSLPVAEPLLCLLDGMPITIPQPLMWDRNQCLIGRDVLTVSKTGGGQWQIGIRGACFLATTPPDDGLLEEQSFLRKFPDIQKLVDQVRDLPPGVSLLEPHHVPLKPDVREVRHRRTRFAGETADMVCESIKDDLRSGAVARVPFCRWISRLVAVTKDDKAIRRCIDLRDVNDNCIPLVGRTFEFEDFVARVSGAQIFSVVDLRSAFHQLALVPEDHQLFGFQDPDGALFVHTTLVMGYVNASVVFQSRMDELLGDVPGTLTCTDDIIIFSRNATEHARALSAVLRKLIAMKLHISPKKLKLARSSVQFCGHMVSSEGVAPPADRTAAIASLSPSDITTSVRLRAFLGLTGYFRKFIRDYARRSSNLRKLAQSPGRLVLEKDALAEFDDLRLALTKAPVLAAPDFTLPFQLETDWSKEGIGAVLTQAGKPIAFFSKACNVHERNYSPSEGEALAVMAAVRRFDQYLRHQKFTIITDNNALEFLKKSNLCPKLARYAVELQGYDFDIRYRRGALNQAADALSRVLFASPSVVPVLLVEVAKSEVDPYFDSICADLRDGKEAEGIDERELGLRFSWSAEDDCWYYQDKHGARKVPHPRDRPNLVREVHHAAGHRGVDKTLAVMQVHFWWPSLRRDVAEAVASCGACSATGAKSVPSQYGSRPLPARPFERLHLDVAYVDGPRGPKVIIAVDALTRWPEAAVLEFKEATATAAFLEDLLARYGAAVQELVYDKGSEFRGDFDRLAKRHGLKQVVVLPERHASNGLAERMVGILKAAIRRINITRPAPLREALARTLATQRFTRLADMGISPAQAVYGYDPHSPIARMVDNMVERDPTKLRPTFEARGRKRPKRGDARGAQCPISIGACVVRKVDLAGSSLRPRIRRYVVVGSAFDRVKVRSLEDKSETLTLAVDAVRVERGRPRRLEPSWLEDPSDDVLDC